MRQRIIHYLRAGYAGLYVLSPEEQRVEAEFKAIAAELNFRLHVWSATSGLLDVTSRSIRDCNDPMAVLLAIAEIPDKAIILLRDFHAFLAGDPNPILVRQLKEILSEAKTRNKALVLVGCRLCLPPEIEREVVVIDFNLPGKDQLATVLHGVLTSAHESGINLPEVGAEQEEALLSAATGLTTIEAENAVALSIVEANALDPAIIAREKTQAVKKSGLLELVETKESFDSIGGLDVLKSWLLRRKHAFSQKAHDYGLPIPKGLLIMGMPGTGKSLTAKATAAVLEVPLLRLDAGRIFGGLVGQSESNLRSVIQTAQAIAPCVLWLDEIEKGLAGSTSSGLSDGGTSARVFGSFISWMAEKTVPVFVVATANDVSQLPPEFLRKGRWDELFFVDFPTQAERQEIWRIQIARHGRDPKDFDLVQLAKAAESLTGSEIEAAFVEALYRAFDEDQEPTDLTIAQVLTDLVPLAKSMSDRITALRAWAKGRTRLATSSAAQPKHRRLAA